MTQWSWSRTAATSPSTSPHARFVELDGADPSFFGNPDQIPDPIEHFLGIQIEQPNVPLVLAAIVVVRGERVDDAG
jgi:hypothetical protein